MSRGRTERRRAAADLKAASDHVDLHAWRSDRYGLAVSMVCLCDGLEREHAAVLRAREVWRRWPVGGAGTTA